MSTYSHLLAARATLQVGEFKPHEPSYSKVYPDRYSHIEPTPYKRWPFILRMFGMKSHR
ncbi:MAG: hypothetical protein AAF636_19880 [Pseudomonadota bacterium]